MTSRISAESDRPESASSADPSAAVRVADEGPYARPAAVPQRQVVDAVLIDAIRASVGPFVPAPWRSASTTTAPARPTVLNMGAVETPSGAAVVLPWIDTFLDTPEAAVDDTAGEASTSSPVVEEVTLPAEEWPLAEAGDAMRAIADDLGRSEVAAPVASTPPLPMWNDDDMNIMPVRVTPATSENGEHWAARTRRENAHAGNPETAAQALEALAQRVRSGEIQLPGFSSEMGEAAALAAALSALLSARR